MSGILIGIRDPENVSDKFEICLVYVVAKTKFTVLPKIVSVASQTVRMYSILCHIKTTVTGLRPSEAPNRSNVVRRSCEYRRFHDRQESSTRVVGRSSNPRTPNQYVPISG